MMMMICLLTITSSAVRHELIVGWTAADVRTLRIDALSVLTRLRRLALVHVRAIETGHYWGERKFILAEEYRNNADCIKSEPAKMYLSNSVWNYNVQMLRWH